MDDQLLKRLEDARLLLTIYGYLSIRESQNISKKVQRDCDKAGLKVEIRSLYVNTTQEVE